MDFLFYLISKLINCDVTRCCRSGGYEEDGQLGHGTLLDQLKYIYTEQTAKEEEENEIAEMKSEEKKEGMG